MKKVLVLFILFSLILMGCSNSSLPGEIKDRIIDDYYNYSISLGNDSMEINDIEIMDFYGCYHKSYVIKINRGAFEVITKKNIGDIEFVFPDTNLPLVWNDGTFYELEDAFSNNLITKDDLLKLKDKSNL